MEGKDFLMVLLIIAFSFFVVANKIIELENKVKDLEKQSEEVHEYILNRIGG